MFQYNGHAGLGKAQLFRTQVPAQWLSILRPRDFGCHARSFGCDASILVDLGHVTVEISRSPTWRGRESNSD